LPKFAGEAGHSWILYAERELPLPMIVVLSINDAKTVLERPPAAQQLSQDSNAICSEGQLKNSSNAAEIAGYCQRHTRESIAGRFEPAGTRFAVWSQRLVADK
jgi:hypothetical protein